MIYHYSCNACGSGLIKCIDVALRDNPYFCAICKAPLTRQLSTGEATKHYGAIEASKRDGVGCFVDEFGRICTPKTRGTKNERMKKDPL